MDPQSWLNYLKSEGLLKDSVNHIPIPRPHYPYQNSLYFSKGTQVNHDIHTYLIELQFLKQDNTTVAISPGNRDREASVVSSGKLDDIIKFLTFHKDWAYKQPGGIPFTSKSRGTYNPSPYKANKYYNPIEVDELFAAFPSSVSPGSELSFAEGLRKLIELITEVKQAERRTEYVSKQEQKPSNKPKESQQQNIQQKQQEQKSTHSSTTKSTETITPIPVSCPAESNPINLETMYPYLPIFPPGYKDKIKETIRDRRINDVNYPHQKNKDTLYMETIYIAIENIKFRNVELGEKMNCNANDTIFSSIHRTVSGKGIDQKLILKFYLPGNYKVKNNQFK